jgi:hypothetical protein
MRKIALAFFLLVASACIASAQNVTVVGPITAGNCTIFNSTTIVKDGGFACPSTGPAVPGMANVKSPVYGAKGDAAFCGNGGDAAITNGTGALSANCITFTTADVGKTVNVAGAGAAGAAYSGTITAFVSAHAVTVSPNASTTVTGAAIEYGTDDTVAIQAAITAVTASGGCVYLPSSKYFVKRLNATGLGRFCMVGDTAPSSYLIANAAQDYSGSAGHVLDLTGSGYVYLSGFSIGWQINGQYAVAQPQSGIFMSQIAGNPSNLININEVRVTGKYTAAAVYNNAVASSQIKDSQFFNFVSGAGLNRAAVIMTASNVLSLTSAFQTVTAPGTDCSDWTITGTEVHSFNNTTGSAAWFDTCTDIRVLGSNWSAGGAQYIRGTGTNARFAFYGTTFQTESDPTTPTNLWNQTAGTLTGLCDEANSNLVGIIGSRYAGTVTQTCPSTLNGVTYPNSYTSGGIPYASSASTIASSGLLAANAPVVGGGAGAAPSTITAGLSGQILAGQTGLVPAFTANPLLGTNGSVAGQLSIANGNGGGASVAIINNATTVGWTWIFPSGPGTTGQPLLSGGGGGAQTYGTLGAAGGGTGQATLTANAFLTGNGTGAINQVAITGLVKGNGASAPTAYGGTSCTNQFPRSLDLNGAATCATVANTDLANSSVTYGTTTVSLGGASTSIAGVTSLGLTSAATENWNSDTFVGRAAAANIMLGQADAAAPVAQTLSVQNVVAGTSNTAGANFTIKGSASTGTGAPGNILFQVAATGTTGTTQNSFVTAWTMARANSASTGGELFYGSTNGCSTTYDGCISTVTKTAGNFAVWFLGQDGTHGFQLAWIGNATPGNATAQITTSGYNNPITFDAQTISFQTASGGNLGFGTTATVSTFNGTVDATSTSTGTIINKGGMAVNKRVWMNGLTSVSVNQSAYVCQASTGELVADTSAVNLCVASSREFKRDIESLTADSGLAEVMRLRPVSYRYKPEGLFRNDKPMVGLIAEEVAEVDARIVGYANDKPHSVQYELLTAILIKAIQELKADNDNLRISIQRGIK